MSLVLSIATLLPVGVAVSVVLAALRRDRVGPILRAAARNLTMLVGGLVALAVTVQALVWVLV